MVLSINSYLYSNLDGVEHSNFDEFDVKKILQNFS